MKLRAILIPLIILSFFSCKNKSKSKEIADYKYSSEIQLNETLQKRVGSWIKEGDICYGILAATDTDGEIVRARLIKAKVSVIRTDAIKMRALESVTIAPQNGCTKMGLEKGDTWWEKEGDLFQTKEEAFEFAKKALKSSRSKNIRGSRFTVD